MSNFCSFQKDKDVERKVKAIFAVRREYTQSEKNNGMEAKLGELNLLKWGRNTD